MRRPRMGILVGVVGIVLLTAGWALAASGATGGERRSAARPIGPSVPRPLLRELQGYLGANGHARSTAPRPHAWNVVPAPRLPPRIDSRTCFVARGGYCSITPCVVPIATGAGPGCPAVAQPARPLRVSRPRPPTFRLTTP